MGKCNCRQRENGLDAGQWVDATTDKWGDKDVGFCDNDGITCDEPEVLPLTYTFEWSGETCEYCSDSDDTNVCVPLEPNCEPESHEITASGSEEEGPHPMWYPDCPQAECNDLHHPGDGQQPGDECWDPPMNYCAEGQSEAVVKACAPDMSVCCFYGGSCIPCGWVNCSYCGDGLYEPETACGDDEQHQGSDEVPECAEAPLSLLADPNCPIIDWDQPICREGS